MSKKRKRRARKQRRASRAVLKHGPTARPRHKLISGRTGTAHSKKTPPSALREGERSAAEEGMEHESDPMTGVCPCDLHSPPGASGTPR